MGLLVAGVTRIVERIYVITCIRPGRYKLFPQLVISFSFITLLDFALNILLRAARGAAILISSLLLRISMEKPEIPVGKSTGSRHSVWEVSENMGCVFRQCNFSTLFSLFN